MINPISLISKYVSPTVLKNSGWLILDKLIAAAISFVVYFVIANYLGPEKLGSYNYALSTVSLFATFGTLGLDSLMVKDFILGKFPQKNIMGSVFILRLIGSVLVLVISVFVVWISKHDMFISLLTIILSSAYLFRSFQVLDPWFLSNKNVKPSVIARTAGALLSAILKILFILLKLDVMYFAIATSLEFVISVVFLLAMYKLKYKQNISDWKMDWVYVKYLLSKGWVLSLGVMFAAFASRFDQYMIGTISGNHAVGIYSPAAKISEFWYYVPMAFLDAMYPGLVEAKKISKEIFNTKLERTSMILFYISLIFCILISLFAGVIINLFLKAEFAGASDVLRIYVWGTLGTVMTSFLMRWLIIEEKQGQLIIASFINFLLNVILNVILVPKLGIVGGAWATAISYNIGWVLVCLIFNRDSISKVVLRSVFLPFQLLKKLLISKK